MGERQRVAVQPAAHVPSARARQEREPVAAPLRRMMAVRALQPQLAVGAVDDPFEREAERTAEAVTSTNQPAPGAFGSLLRVAQRALGKRETPTKKDEDEKTKKVQKKPSASPGPEVVPRGVESQIQTLSAGGEPLSPSLRSVFEPRFGYDFGSVRTHTGSDAAGAAVALGARAFTVGDHIFFGAGEYQPSSASGQRLIAHELTHTIQQKPVAARVQRSLFGDARAAVLERIRGWARELPPYELLTVLLGRDPITQQVVERSGVNVIHAALRLVPNGQEIFNEMRQSGSLDRAASWFDAEIARLNLTWQGIRALFTQAWDATPVTDLLHPSVVWQRIRDIFGPTLRRIRDFAVAVGGRILDFIKERVLQRLRAWAQEIPGYRLLTFILGRDPFTQEPVPRTAVTFVRAVLDLVPDGDEIFQNLQRTRTIERSMEWLRGEIARLDLTWDAIRALFLRAWNAFTVADLLRPLALIERIGAIFADPARRVGRFALAVGRKVLEFIFEGAMALAGPLGQQVVRIVRRAGQVFDQIVADPVGFVRNLVGALRLGFTQFLGNILTHMRTALVRWLTSALEGAGLQLPEQWDLAGIFSLVLQILGITWQRIRQKIVRIIGEERMQTLERVFDIIQTVITRGPMAIWDRIVEAFGNLWESVIGGIRQWAITRIVEAAVTRLLTLFNPAGAIIQAIIATYNTIKFFVERIRQIADTVESIVESIARIAAGVLGPAANAVERAMARTLPVVLDFLARLIGLGDVSGQIRRVIEALQQRVDRALDRAVDWVIERGRALLARFGRPAASARDRVLREDFAMQGAGHHLEVRVANGRVTLLMASGELMELQRKAGELRDLYLNRAEVTFWSRRDPTRIPGLTADLNAVDQRASLVASQFTAAPDQAAQDRVIRDAINDLRTMLSGIGSRYNIRGLNYTPPTYQYHPSNVDTYHRAVGVDAVVSLQARDRGTSASVDPPGFYLLQGYAAYERGHLLANSLGGPGGDVRNIAPMDNPTNRSASGMQRPEDAARRAIDGPPPPDPPVVLAYRVQCVYETNTDPFQTWLEQQYGAAPQAVHRIFVAVRNNTIGDQNLASAMVGASAPVTPALLAQVQSTRMQLRKQIAWYFMARRFNVTIGTQVGPTVSGSGPVVNHQGVTLP